MVWFQCEDCGENLKKPKLANHFRGCPAQKLSCIDCGVIFTQQTVQGHTQCISEAEKYGPKTVGFIKKEDIKTSGKEKDCDGLDASIGLSTRSPWSCSLCNVKTTSQETLLLHSQGKKHKSKVRSFTSISNGKDAVLRVSTLEEGKNTVFASGPNEKDLDKCKLENGCSREDSVEVDDRDRQPAGAIPSHQPEAKSIFTTGSKEQTVSMEKKRKLSADMDTRPFGKTKGPTSGVKEGETFIKASGDKENNAEHWVCKKYMNGHSNQQGKKGVADGIGHETWSCSVKWKKLIKKALKNAPGGSLKVKQLRRSILPPAMDLVKNSGLDVSKESFSRELERQIQSHAKFIMDGKFVRLAP